MAKFLHIESSSNPVLVPVIKGTGEGRDHVVSRMHRTSARVTALSLGTLGTHCAVPIVSFTTAPFLVLEVNCYLPPLTSLSR